MCRYCDASSVAISKTKIDTWLLYLLLLLLHFCTMTVRAKGPMSVVFNLQSNQPHSDFHFGLKSDAQQADYCFLTKISWSARSKGLLALWDAFKEEADLFWGERAFHHHRRTPGASQVSIEFCRRLRSSSPPHCLMGEISLICFSYWGETLRRTNTLGCLNEVRAL